MAKARNTRILQVKASSLAMFEGSFAGIIGFGIAVLHSLRTTVDIAGETESVLSGMAFGLATGIVSIIVLPIIYFAFGWVIGYIHGFIFNVVSETSGGIELTMSDD